MKQSATGTKKRLLLIIILGIFTVVFLQSCAFTKYEVEGESMMPTLQDGNLLIVNKLGVRFGDVERFDIIVFQGNTDDYVKRIIGLPGDELEYKDDTLYINGKDINEPFLNSYKLKLVGGNLTGDFTLEEVTGETIVPEESYFVLGDNRLGSWDSRHFGLIKKNQIVGKVDIRYWPAGDWYFDFD
ncbi:signal peptidase I [Litchfieldia salsa]|uniref:Signal peptidase I n=1 Tax=Litchfieldia salsa TaxID=930152 RepID=A0A1H0UNC7_9BACI|nr:signal peptidase I [Litchfieldia salsa]SDP67644.1 signal peptidase I [Litchfieldia salsa]